jgi:orotidine-5'-phosphate decarboxylase
LLGQEALSVIVAIDDMNPEKSKIVVKDTCEYVSGFKIGLPFLLENGINIVHNLKELCKDKMWIADLKLADIGYIMSLIALKLRGIFDYVIAHSFVGVEGALDELSETCRKTGLNLILVATMTHKDARNIYDYMLVKIREIIERTGAWGIVAPATRKDIIKFLREILGLKISILSPGIGPQGALPGEALCAGANYEIIGRLITEAKDYKEKVIEILELQREALRRCRP